MVLIDGAAGDQDLTIMHKQALGGGAQKEQLWEHEYHIKEDLSIKSLSLSAISFDFGDHAVPQPSAPSLLY